MPLSDVAIRKAKPAEKPYKLTDAAGLYLLVSTTGARLWRMDYRHGGKRKTLAFGDYPTLGLADARERRDAARRQLADGLDPVAAKRRRRAQDAVTFGAVADEFLERQEKDGMSSATLDKNRWLLTTLAAGLRERPIAEIVPADVLAVLQVVERSGRLESARRLRSTIGSVFRLAISTLRATNDPTFPLRGALRPPVVQGRAAITDPKKFGGLLRALDEYDGWPTLKAILQFQSVVFQRPVEVRLAEWGEVQVEKAVWTIPAERAKMRRPHDVPLSRQALAILEGIRPLTGSGRLIFPSIRKPDVPISENGMNSALRRMGFTQEEHTSHGFRSSASTILSERGFDEDVIERCLAHLDPNRVKRAYNRAEKWPERVLLMQRWADLCDEMRSTKS